MTSVRVSPAFGFGRLSVTVLSFERLSTILSVAMFIVHSPFPYLDLSSAFLFLCQSYAPSLKALTSWRLMAATVPV